VSPADADRLDVDGVLLDIDGTLVVSWQPIPGAPEALADLRGAGVPFRLMTNTTELSVRTMADTMLRVGFDVRPEDLVTAPVATAAYLRVHHPEAGCFLLGLPGVAEDMRGVNWVDEEATKADVVVAGGADEAYTWENLNRVFRMLLDGAALVAMHRNMFWMAAEGMKLDAGAFLLGLEEAAGVRAAVAGKPAPEFFRQAVGLLGVAPERVAMVGDDLDADILAAQAVGLTGVLVRTGKFRPEALNRPGPVPDLIIDSVADLPGLLRTS
jgi:HAD superfamily hydrolase (TIGR01458 family)